MDVQDVLREKYGYKFDIPNIYQVGFPTFILLLCLIYSIAFFSSSRKTMKVVVLVQQTAVPRKA